MESLLRASAASGPESDGKRRAQGSDRTMALVACLAIGLAAAIFALNHKPETRPISPPLVQVDATDLDGHVRLSWNPDLPQLKGATGGTLEVHDGEKSESYPLDAKVLSRGSLDYVRGSDDVLLGVTFLENGRPASQAKVRVVASLVAEAAPAAVAAATPTRARMSDPPKPQPPKAKAAPKTKKVVKAKKPAKKPPTQFVPHF